MNFETLVLGIGIATATIAGFFYLLKLQDKWFDKMTSGNDGSLRV